MNSLDAKALTTHLVRRAEMLGVYGLNADEFEEGLSMYHIPGVESSRFYTRVRESQEVEMVEDGEKEKHTLTLTRVLANFRAKGYQLSTWKAALAKVLGKIDGVYSSTALTRDIRTNPELVTLMDNSFSSYSLLGKLETQRGDTITTRPLLVIPEWVHPVMNENHPIHLWEQKFTLREKEGSGFIGLPCFKTLKS